MPAPVLAVGKGPPAAGQREAAMESRRTELKWGLIFVAVQLAWMGLERVVGLHGTHIDLHMALTNLFAIPAIAVYVFALHDKKRNDLGGVMSYREGFISGLVISLVVTVLSPATQWITSTIITPDYFENAIAYSVESGFHDSVEEARAYFNLRNYLLQAAVGGLVMGVLTSAIVAFFLRSRGERPPV